MTDLIKLYNNGEDSFIITSLSLNILVLTFIVLHYFLQKQQNSHFTNFNLNLLKN